MTCGRVSMVVGLVVGVVASPGRWLATRRTRCAHALRPSQAAAQGLPVARLVLARSERVRVARWRGHGAPLLARLITRAPLSAAVRCGGTAFQGAAVKLASTDSQKL